MINLNEEYATVERLFPVRFYCTDGGGGYPIHGAYLNKTWIATQWDSAGLSCCNATLNLVRVTRETRAPFPDEMLEDLVGRKIKRKENGYITLITGYDPEAKRVHSASLMVYSAEELFNSFSIKDGKNWVPCGTKA